MKKKKNLYVWVEKKEENFYSIPILDYRYLS
jgi:hypothetical protein